MTEQEKQENKAIRDRLVIIAERMGYKATVSDEQFISYVNVKLEKDGQILYFNANGYKNRGKLTVSGSYPRSKTYGYITPRSECKDINISLSKTNLQIIRDIEKRFIPSYRIALREVQEKVRYFDECEKNREEIIKKVGEKLSIESHSGIHGEKTLHKYEYSENIKNIRVNTNHEATELNFEISLNKFDGLRLADFIRSLRVI